MGLEGSHVKVGNEVHHPYCSCHKRYLILFIAQELNHLQQKIIWKVSVTFTVMCLKILKTLKISRGWFEKITGPIPAPLEGLPSCRRKQEPLHQHHSWPSDRGMRRVLWQTGAGMVPSVDLGKKAGVWRFHTSHLTPVLNASAWCLPIIAWMQLRTSTGRNPWYEAVPVQSMIFESLGVLSRWTIEVKVRKDAAFMSWN